MSTFDFIICGAGTAGCILANRLSADPGCNVLLLEAGDEPRQPLNHALGAAVDHWDGPLDWAFRSTPQENLNGRRILLNRGKALGGSSAINFGMYVRGNRGDYDHWAQLGNVGWSYESVLPYFIRSESNATFANEFHGTDGPIPVENPRNSNPIQELYFQALEDMGVPRNPDYNGATQEGCFLYQFNTRDGRRCSAADAYLSPARERTNLTVETRALVTGLQVENGRVTGVHYAQGREAKVAGSKETILALGAIGSPHLLLLSGIGPVDDIERHGIRPIHDLPGVGKNLLDHFGAADVGLTLKEPERFGFPIPSHAESLARFERDRSGPLATPQVDAGAFVRLRSTDEYPSMQHFCVVSDGHRHRGTTPPGVSLDGYLCRTVSQGEIRLASSSPFDRPLIDPRYLSDPSDLELAVEMTQWCLDLVEHRMFDDIRASIFGPERNRDAIVAAIRAEASTIWHQTSTCRMGGDDRAVVAPDLRVHGLEGIRVIDASVFPTMTSGNTNAPTMMIAEKGADLALGIGAPC